MLQKTNVQGAKKLETHKWEVPNKLITWMTNFFFLIFGCGWPVVNTCRASYY